LKAGLWFRRGRLFMLSPVRGDHRRFQAETPLIGLFKFPGPALGIAKFRTNHTPNSFRSIVMEF
jgi:hypothetical protein